MLGHKRDLSLSPSPLSVPKRISAAPGISGGVEASWLVRERLRGFSWKRGEFCIFFLRTGKLVGSPT